MVLVVWILLLRSSILLVVAAGCAAAPDPWGCADQACREAAVLSAWETEPGDAVEQLHRVSDGLDRIAIISSLIDHHPGDTGALCEMLPHGMSQERCLSVNGEPEIWRGSGISTERGSRAGPGPSSSSWSAQSFEASDFINERGNPQLCAEEVDAHACAWGWSRAYAKDGDVDRAARMCASVRTTAPNPSRWRHSCFLSAATLHVLASGRTGLVESVRLCGASGDFKALCAERLLHHLASQAPPSDVGGGRAWSDHLMRAQAIRQAWNDSPMLPELMDRFWAQSMAASTAKAHGMSGDALDVLPLAAIPHIRAAVVWEWMSRQTEVGELAVLQAAIAKVLSIRLERKPPPVETGLITPMVDMWPVDRDGESHLAAVSYFGSSRRTMARDPNTDIGLCVLEASARLDPPAHSVISSGLGSSDERLRWTAARLVEQLEAKRLGVAETPNLPPLPALVVPTPSL